MFMFMVDVVVDRIYACLYPVVAGLSLRIVAAAVVVVDGMLDCCLLMGKSIAQVEE